MIKNERQYKITKKLLAEWETNHYLLHSGPLAKFPVWLHGAQRETVMREIKQLKAQLREYESVRSGRKKLFDISFVNQLPESLINWRIACNLTQKELARLLGLHEQQIQRYENTAYSGASLATISQIAKILQNYKAKRA